MNRALGAALAGLLLVSCRQQVQPPVVSNNAQAEVPSFANVVLGNMELPAQAPDFPALTGRVVDNANLLTPAQEAALSARAETLERQTGAQFVIATVPSLGGRSIEDYATALGNRWNIGGPRQYQGALLLVAPNERRVRIAVGSGLMSAFADAEAQAIIDRDMLPAFRESRFFDGIDRASQAIVARIARAGASPPTPR